MKPDELIPDGVDGGDFNGRYVRKGTIGAFIQNALTLTDTTADEATRQQCREDLLSLIADLEALQVFDVFELRDPELKKIVHRIARFSQRKRNRQKDPGLPAS
jgi:hypothetical protein